MEMAKPSGNLLAMGGLIHILLKGDSILNKGTTVLGEPSVMD